MMARLCMADYYLYIKVHSFILEDSKTSNLMEKALLCSNLVIAILEVGILETKVGKAPTSTRTVSHGMATGSKEQPLMTVLLLILKVRKVLELLVDFKNETFICIHVC